MARFAIERVVMREQRASEAVMHADKPEHERRVMCVRKFRLTQSKSHRQRFVPPVVGQICALPSISR